MKVTEKVLPIDTSAPHLPHPESSQKFTRELFNRFLQSRPQGISQRTVESYHYTLAGFIDYPLTAEGIIRYLNVLSCGNGKLKFYSCLRTLFGWLHQDVTQELDRHATLDTTRFSICLGVIFVNHSGVRHISPTTPQWRHLAFLLSSAPHISSIIASASFLSAAEGVRGGTVELGLASLS